MVIYFLFFFVCACACVLGMADDCCFLILGGVALSNVSSANMSSAKRFLLNRRFSLALVFWADLEASKRNYHSSRVLNRGSVEIYASISILFFLFTSVFRLNAADFAFLTLRDKAIKMETGLVPRVAMNRHDALGLA